MARLIRPVVVTAVGSGGSQAAELLAEWLPDFPQPVRFFTIETDQLDNETTLDRVAPENVIERLEQAFEQGGAFDALHIHWIGLVAVTGPDGATAQSALLDTLLPAAGRLYANGRPLVLTIVVMDGSVERAADVRTFLLDLAAAVANLGIAASTQVYLMRALMQNGFALRADELIEAGALAAESLVLSNLHGVQMPTDITRANPQNAILLDSDPSQLRIFGRMGVFTLRSLDVEISDLCAAIRLREFGANQTDRSVPVTPLWQPPLVSVNRPQLSDDTSARIGARIRGGPRANFSGAPSLVENPEDEVRRLDNDAESWMRELGEWQRQVRIEFARVLGELRDSSAGERNGARVRLDGQAAALWIDDQISHPIPHLREWIRRQRVSFGEDSRTQHTRAEGLRLNTLTDARAALNEPFRALRFEMSRRPNTALLLPFALGVLLGGAILLWPLFGGIRELAEEFSWISAGMADQAQLLQVLAILLLLVTVIVAAGSSLWEANLRWKRAYQRLTTTANNVSRKEVQALEREISLVDSHWYIKTISSCRRHLGKLDTRVGRLDAQLARPRLRRVDEFDRTGRLVRFTPDIASDTRSELETTLALMPADEVTSLFRNRQMSGRWISGDVEQWTRESHQALRHAFLKLRHDHHGDANADIRHAIAELAHDWPALSNNFIVPDYHHNQLGISQTEIMFGTGVMGGIASQGGNSAFLGNPVLFDSNRDEVLLCRVQTGLTAETVIA